MSAPSQSIDALRNALNRFSAQPVQRKLITSAALVTVVSSLVWCVRDYREYLSLGPGGLPYNVLGWAIVTLILRPFSLSKRQALSTADYPNHGAHDEVKELPQRKGERAVAKGLVPHRQVTQNAPEAMRTKIVAMFDKAIEQYPSVLQKKKSLYEQHNDALFVSDPVLSHEKGNAPQTTTTTRGEIGHMHGDLSVHMILSPADAKLAIEKGWAERHLLARPKPLFGKTLFRLVPTYLLFYGPRNDEELEVMAQFLQSSIRFHTGSEDIHLTAE